MSIRLWYPLVLAVAIVAGTASAPKAQSAEQEAAKRNEEGKNLWLKKNDLAGAVEKFREATTLSPQPNYYFNLCYAQHQLGRFQQARTSCRAVLANGADDKLAKKANLVLDDIAKRIPDEPDPTTTTNGGDGDGANGGDGDGANGGDGDGMSGGDGDGTNGGDGDGISGGDGDGTNGGNGATGGNGTVGNGTSVATSNGANTAAGGAAPPATGPIPGLYQPAKRPDDYKWALGVDVGFTGTTLGKNGNYDFGAGGGAVKAYLDFAGLRSVRAGAQLYVNVLSMNGDYSLVAADLGGALYKHIPLGRFYVTPLAGAHLTVLQSPDDFAGDSALIAIGVRAEGSGTWLFGPDRKHALKATLAFGYLLGAADDEFGDADETGLNQPSTSFSLLVGYSLRFTTPFGRTSLITLE